MQQPANLYQQQVQKQFAKKEKLRLKKLRRHKALVREKRSEAK